jgi:hypothetical protein
VRERIYSYEQGQEEFKSIYIGLQGLHVVKQLSQKQHQYTGSSCVSVQGNASEPKLWPLQSTRKKSRAADEEDTFMSLDMQHNLDECELDADDSFANNEQEEVVGGPNKKLLMELKLHQLTILRQMAQEGSNPTGLRDQVRRLGLTAEVEGDDGGGRHRQSKLKNLRRIGDR